MSRITPGDGRDGVIPMKWRFEIGGFVELVDLHDRQGFSVEIRVHLNRSQPSVAVAENGSRRSRLGPSPWFMNKCVDGVSRPVVGIQVKRPEDT